MKIGINASWMMPGAAGGLEWYCRNIIQQLASLDTKNDYLLVTAPNNYTTFTLPGSNWKQVVYEGPESAPSSYVVSSSSRVHDIRTAAARFVERCRRLGVRNKPRFWDGRLRDLIEYEGIQLWFCPIIYALPLDTTVPIVICIPDLQHEHHPEFFRDAERAQRTMGYPHSCKSAAAVIAISKFTADDIVKRYAVDSRRVFTIPLGLDSSFIDFDRDLDHLVSHVRVKYGLDTDYIYYPAAAWAHKNHDNLLRGLAIARDRGFGCKLILTGWQFDLMSRLRPLLDDLRLRDAVVHLGYVERADVAGILAGARALIFPSLFEGFGLPVLEALHLGVPVGCANLCSLPEVGGDAVEFFDPNSPASIADAILKLTGDDVLRGRLSEAGKRQAARFSYRGAAEETLNVFHRIRDGQLEPPVLPAFRPPISHNWILDGHSTWYFHCATLAQLEIELATLPELVEQRVRVDLNEQTVVDCELSGAQDTRFVVECNRDVPGGFHRLDVTASSKVEIKGQMLSVRVIKLRIRDAQGASIDLLR